jgi:hypothetical protein
MSPKRVVIFAAVVILIIACICVRMLLPLSLWDQRSIGPGGRDVSAVNPGIVQRWGRILQEGRGVDAVNTGAEVVSARSQLVWSRWVHGADHAATQKKLQVAISSLKKVGDFVSSERLARDLLASRERTMGSDHWETLNAVHQLGFLLWKNHEYTQAAYHFECELERRRLGNSPWSTANAAYMLSNTLDRMNVKPETALELAELALEEYIRDPNTPRDMIESRARAVREYIQQLKDKTIAGTHKPPQ